MTERCHLPENGVFRCCSQTGRRTTKHIRGTATRKDKPGKPVSQSCLADSFRAAQHPGVAHPSGRPGFNQFFLGFCLTQKFRIFPWWQPGRVRRINQFGRGRFFTHKVMPSRSRTAPTTSSCTASTVRSASITTQRSGSRRAISRKPARTRS